MVKRLCEIKRMYDIESELFDIFEGEKWFHYVKLREVENQYYEINLIVNESFSIWDFNDVKNELKYIGFKIYNDNIHIKKREGKYTYSVKFTVEGVREWLKELIDFQVAVW